METVDNSVIILMFVLSTLLLIFFILYLVKYLILKRQLKAKNRRLFALTDERNALRKSEMLLKDQLCEKEDLLSDVPDKIASLEKQIEDAKALTQATTLAYRQAYKEALGILPDVEVNFTPSPEEHTPTPVQTDRQRDLRAFIRKMDECVLASMVHHRPAAGRNELSEASGIDRKTIEANFKELGLDIVEYLDRFRVDEALVKLTALKNSEKKNGEEVPEEEDTTAEIAQLCGFDKESGLNKAIKRLYGMSLDELMAIL